MLRVACLGMTKETLSFAFFLSTGADCSSVLLHPLQDTLQPRVADWELSPFPKFLPSQFRLADNNNANWRYAGLQQANQQRQHCQQPANVAFYLTS
jgi:hypothetical protein